MEGPLQEDLLTPRDWWEEAMEKPLTARELQARLEVERSSLALSVREFHSQQLEATEAVSRSLENKFSGAMDALNRLSIITESRLRDMRLEMEALRGEQEAEDVRGNVNKVLTVVRSDIQALQGQHLKTSGEIQALQRQQCSMLEDLKGQQQNVINEVQSQLSSDAWEIQSQITGDMSQLMGEVEALRALHGANASGLEALRRELQDLGGAAAGALVGRGQSGSAAEGALAQLLADLQALQAQGQLATSGVEALSAQHACHEATQRTLLSDVGIIKSSLADLMKSIQGVSTWAQDQPAGGAHWQPEQSPWGAATRRSLGGKQRGETQALRDEQSNEMQVPTGDPAGLADEMKALRSHAVCQQQCNAIDTLRIQLRNEIDAAHTELKGELQGMHYAHRHWSVVDALQSQQASCESWASLEVRQREHGHGLEALRRENRECGSELRELQRQSCEELRTLRSAQEQLVEEVKSQLLGGIEALQASVSEDMASLRGQHRETAGHVKATEISQAQLNGSVRALKNSFKVLQIQQSRHTAELEALRQPRQQAAA